MERCDVERREVRLSEVGLCYYVIAVKHRFYRALLDGGRFFKAIGINSAKQSGRKGEFGVIK